MFGSSVYLFYFYPVNAQNGCSDRAKFFVVPHIIILLQKIETNQFFNFNLRKMMA